MFPTGFAVVFSGLLLRMRNEAQLPGVIAHESGHFLRRHMIRIWRDERRKTDIFAIGAMLAGRRRRGRAASISAIMSSWPSSAPSSRCSDTAATMEAEADAMGARLIAEAGYDADGDVDHLAAADRRGERRARATAASIAAARIAVRHPPVGRRAHGRPRADAPKLTVPGKAYDNRARALPRDDRRRSARCCSTTRSSSTIPARASI